MPPMSGRASVGGKRSFVCPGLPVRASTTKSILTLLMRMLPPPHPSLLVCGHEPRERRRTLPQPRVSTNTRADVAQRARAALRVHNSTQHEMRSISMCVHTRHPAAPQK